MKEINIKIDKNVFNEVYLPYMFDYKTHKTLVFMGGAGSGKSHALAQLVVLKALSSKRKILILRKISATLKDSVWQLILDTLSFFQLYDGCTINKSEMKIILPNQSILLFKGVDDAGERLKSITGLTDVWIEEATEISLDEFTQIKLRIRAKTPNNQIFLSYNPIDRNNWVFNAFHNEETRDNSVHVLKTTYKDNKFLPDDYIAELENMKEINPYYYQVYALGEFGTTSLTVYNNWKVEKLDIQELLKQNLQLCCGIDTGFTHPYAITISLVDKANKIIYVIDEMSKRGITNADAYNWICDNGYGANQFIADSASPRDIEELRRMGLRIKGAKKGHNSVRNGIQRILNYRVVISETCTNFIDEIMGYAWKKDKNGNYLDEVQAINDDLLDSWRYSLEGVLDRRKPKILTVKL